MGGAVFTKGCVAQINLKTSARCDKIATVCNITKKCDERASSVRGSGSEPGRVGAGRGSVRENPSGAAG